MHDTAEMLYSLRVLNFSLYYYVITHLRDQRNSLAIQFITLNNFRLIWARINPSIKKKYSFARDTFCEGPFGGSIVKNFAVRHR